MGFMLDSERVLLAMVGGGTLLMVTGVRPRLPADTGDLIAGSIWQRFNIGAISAVSVAVLVAAARVADGEKRALVHVVGGLVLLAVLVAKSRQDSTISATVHSDAGAAAVRREVQRVIPMVVAVLALSLALSLAPA